MFFHNPYTADLYRSLQGFYVRHFGALYSLLHAPDGVLANAGRRPDAVHVLRLRCWKPLDSISVPISVSVGAFKPLIHVHPTQAQHSQKQGFQRAKIQSRKNNMPTKQRNNPS